MRKTTKIVALPLALVLVLSACSSTPLPDQIVTKFMDAVKAVDVETLSTYVVQEQEAVNTAIQPEDPTGAEVMKTIFGRMAYEVGEATISGETATVPVTITCVAVADVFKEAMANAMGLAFTMAFSEESTQEDIQAMFEETLVNALKDPEAKMTTEDITLTLNKVDGKWLISLNGQSGQDFINAITGGLGDFANALNELGDLEE